ncbi:MAG: tripartite tricarboxylate transporter permease [Deltaproteobacteria bacterium]|nr:tripartite tricarboxylate transporter permease [Deltaproteobacteria bacterium]
MFEAGYQGLMGILEPWALFLMVAGVIISSLFAALPGVGSLLILTAILPYSLTLTPYQAIALLLGIGVVSNTANTFSSVLIAVPGGAGSQATIVDGYPMAQKGEANRAFGAAFMASAVGGIFGAIVLLASLPILRPLVLSFGSPEFFVLVVWGLSAVGVLSGKAPIKGLLVAIFGVLVSTVGIDEKTGIERFAFNTLYLWGGFNIVIIGLGIFAVPELIEMAVRRTSIAQGKESGSGLMEGIKDVFRNWWLVMRCSVIGVWIGVLPGLGSAVADWFAYAHAVQTEKNSENFGKGDVRGVIAPESSNNAKEGGALIPTIAFGIPGSTSLAIILSAFISVGITPGRRMLTDQLHLTLAMVWVIVLANLLATALSLGFSKSFSKISFLPFYVIVPMTLILCVSASFTSNYSWGDLGVFLFFSLLGYLMKLFGWPRPPLLVAAVLGHQMETYLWLSISLYGFGWLMHPGVIALLLLVLFTLGFPIWRKRGEQGKKIGWEKEEELSRGGDASFTLLLLAAFAVAAYYALEWPLRGSLIIYALAGVGIPLALIQTGLDLFALRRAPKELQALSGDKPQVQDPGKRRAEALLWILGLLGGVILVGFHVTLPCFAFLYAKCYGAGWRLALLLAIIAAGFITLLFDKLLYVVWPTPLLISSWS